MTRIFLSAGESSGDMHGANLIAALRERVPEMACEGLGGVRMAEAGMALRVNLARDAIMGFAEVVRALPMIRRVFRDTVAHLARTRPDALVLIDYPGFNLRLARAAHGLGIPVIYYIGPQVWAWKRKRIETIARYVRKMLVILPFEEALYTDAGVDCTWVGHPLLDELARVQPGAAHRDEHVIGLLPGSREQEIRRIMGVMRDVAGRLRDARPALRFVAPCVDAERERQVRALAEGLPIETAVGNAYDVLSMARLCLVASGTATVEAALLDCPMVVLYKVAPVTYQLARWLVRVPHVAMVNILAQREVVPEFIQHQARTETIAPAALALLDDGDTRDAQLRGLAEARGHLGGPGASGRAADAIIEVAGAAHG